MILVTGATGKTGADVARALLASGERVRTIARNADKAKALAALGVEIASGDGSDRGTLKQALTGVSRVAMIYPNGPAQAGLEQALVEESKAHGVSHIVKLSSMEALPHMTNPVHQTHYRSEQQIIASGIAWTMIRPNFFMQNFYGNAQTIKNEGKFYLPMGSGRAAMTDTRDVAAVIAHVLTHKGHAGKVYEITGPEVMSFADVAAAFARALGKPVTYVDQDPAEYKAYLGKFLTSTWHLDAVCDIFKEIREGYVTGTTNTFQELTGRAPTSFEQFVRDHRQVFGG
jgi:uncharacterized protein YbjT (DUF2867 family)